MGSARPLAAPSRARLAAGVAFLVLTTLGAPGALAQEESWPCVQARVPSLTPAVVWAGPPFEEGLDWEEDAAVAALVGRLSQRRVPVEEAEAEIAAFAEEAGAERLTLLFAGLFETMDAERSAVVAGIERYARRQVAEADAIRAEAAALDGLRERADPAEITRAEEALDWRIRIFDERRGALGYACEVPRLIEQRLFSLGRTVASEIGG